LFIVGAFSRNEYSFWCWVAESNPYYKVAVILFYGCVWISWITAITLYCIVFQKLKRFADIHQDQSVPKKIKALTFILLVFIFQRMSGSINRIIQMMGYSCFWLNYLQAFTDPIQGFANAVVYVIVSPALLKLWRNWCCRSRYPPLIE